MFVCLFFNFVEIVQAIIQRVGLHVFWGTHLWILSQQCNVWSQSRFYHQFLPDNTLSATQSAGFPGCFPPNLTSVTNLIKTPCFMHSGFAKLHTINWRCLFQSTASSPHFFKWMEIMIQSQIWRCLFWSTASSPNFFHTYGDFDTE